MLESLFSSLIEILTLQHLMYMLLGVMTGLMVGILPGLGGIAGLSLLIPFLYGMDSTAALAMLIGLVAVIPTSDTFASVLMGIPGSSASQATVLDGFPLAKQGHAARALSASFFSSLIGGLIGAVILTGFVLVSRPLILSFSSAELFMLVIFGLSMVGVLSGRSLVKGLAACGLGLIIGSIGGAPATGEFRMVLGIDYLYDGIPLVIIGLGLFAVPEIVDLLRRDRSISENIRLGAGWLDGIRDWWRNRWLSLRCSALGAVIGAIPGLGGSVVDWIAYGHAVQSTTKDPKFGQGDIRGVIAPESANNAKEGGGLLPTLLFGIPGSGAMAVFLGGMVLIGIQPGPSMVTTDLGLTYSIIWSLAFANVLGAGLCILLAVPVSRLTLIRFTLLAPFIISAICFAAFQATRILEDLLALLIVGILGVYMRRFGWPRPALLIGFVLATQAETYLYQAVQFYGWNFVNRPGVIIIAVLTLISVWFGMKNHIDDTGTMESRPIKQAGSQKDDTIRKRRPQIIFTVLILAIFTFAVFDALQQSFLGRIFPVTVAGLSIVFALSLLGIQLMAESQNQTIYDQEHDQAASGKTQSRSLLHGVFWIALLVGLTALLGYFLALVIFFVCFLRVRAKVSMIKTVILTTCAAVFTVALSHTLNLSLPEGLLQNTYQLPWPMGNT